MWLIFLKSSTVFFNAFLEQLPNFQKAESRVITVSFPEKWQKGSANKKWVKNFRPLTLKVITT